MELSDLLINKTYTEKRALLNEFYEDAYAMGIYNSTGSLSVWEKVMDALTFDKGLDVGCGSGYGLKNAREAGYNVYGIDLAPSARKRWEKLCIADYCVVGNILNLPFKDNEFDFVLCNDVFEHLLEEDIPQALSELYRVGSDKFCLIAATTKESFPVGGRIHAHITIKPDQWWQMKFDEAGFIVAGKIESLYTEIFGSVDHYGIFAVKNKEPYLKGKSFRN